MYNKTNRNLVVRIPRKENFMMRKFKKGFTIVELVIVIAVIAVLTAVLVPTFVHLSKKAKESSDKSLVHNLNTALQLDMAEGKAKPVTMHDAVEAIDRQGYHVPRLVTKSDQDLVYNIEKNEFCLSNEVKGEHLNYWHIEESMPATQDWSIYAYGWTIKDVENLTVGFDSGDCSFDSIEYERTGSSTDKRSVLIRTNSAATNLSIKAEFDTVDHHGNVGKVDIEKIDMNCYNEFGKSGYVKLSQGKVIAKQGSNIGVVFATNSDADAVCVAKEGNGAIEQAYTTAESIDTANQNKGGIPLAYTIDDQPVTEQAVEEVAVDAIDELAGEEVAEDPNVNSYVARIGTEGFVTFQAAYNAAVSGNKIVLLQNVLLGDIVEGNFAQEELTTSFDFRKAGLTLDLNGKSLVSNAPSTYGFYIAPGAELTIKDSVGTGIIRALRSEQVIQCFGTINLYGGTIKAEYAGGRYEADALHVEGTANIYGGVLTAEAGFIYPGYEEYGTIYNFSLNNIGTTHIYGGTFSCSVKNANYNGVGNCGSLYIHENITVEGLYWVNNGSTATTINVAEGKALTVDGFYVYNQYKASSGGKDMSQSGVINHNSELEEIWIEE